MPPRSRPSARRKKRVRHTRWVYSFDDGEADGHRGLTDLLGGKGANLAEMSLLGLPVPPGFTITTEVCTWFHTHERGLPPDLEAQVVAALEAVEASLGKRFGGDSNPLLLSVRSGARVSMPGMMDTVLNLGLNDVTVHALARESGDARFAWDAYRRFVQMYGDVVLGIKGGPRGSGVDPFRERFEQLKGKLRVALDTEVPASELEKLVTGYKRLVVERTGRAFPEDPREQLWGAIRAVFASWDNERAIAYRALNDIPDDIGTAVSVVAMVFGNLGEDSGTGVAFTRDPATGEKRFYGEYLMNAQGEDVVAGIRTPLPIDTLADRSPRAWRELKRIQKLLEEHYRDMQDLEFTIERGKLYMLQCRNGKRTGPAAVRIASDLVQERRISADEALLRVDPNSLEQLLQPVFDRAEAARARKAGRVMATGLPAGPGAASGRVVFSAADAEAWAARGERVVLARFETSPEDIRGMQAAHGILTARGGMTSHAALVGRQMGKVCVVGAESAEIDANTKRLVAGGHTLREGDWISLDGSRGEVIAGQLATTPSEIMTALAPAGSGVRAPDRARARKSPAWRAFARLMRWADATRRMDVRANADRADQCAMALALGARGVGLCRTEHMFFEGERIDLVREMILAAGPAERAAALARLLPHQRRDFVAIFKTMAPHPVTVRLLDPPLHEFLPHAESEIRALAKRMGVSTKHLRNKVESLREANPMLGHRGCRLGITYPEITRMQTRAILEAACRVAATGKRVQPEIMVPLVGSRAELEHQAAVVRAVAEEVFARSKRRVPYLVGTMIELPRAALVADEIAEVAEFFSFGTNDLTQTTLGISRDDAGFIPLYVEAGIFERDPFQSIDVDGVGRLMTLGTRGGRSTRPDLKVGICGEHGGDPASITFCEELGLEYVSCSPLRVPIARLAAAQATLRLRESD